MGSYLYLQLLFLRIGLLVSKEKCAKDFANDNLALGARGFLFKTE